MKFALTTDAIVVLLQQVPSGTRMSRIVAATMLSATGARDLRLQRMVHAAGRLLVLLAATVL